MRLIDADEPKTRIKKLKSQIASRAAGFVDEDSYECGAVDALHDALTYLDEAPTVDAVPVVHGRWEPIDEAKPRRYRCSRCSFLTWYVTDRYCPMCGAKMDGGDADE